MKTILIIEDDNDINKMLTKLLMMKGYAAKSAYSGTEGLLLHGDDIDLILLDLMLPGKNGDEIISDLKAKKEVPIIVMSAITDVGSKVNLFELGADDYITKPFENEELLARISVRLKRAEAVAGNKGDDGSSGDALAGEHILEYRNIKLDSDNFMAECNGTVMDLSKHEFLLLELFLKNPKRICTKSMIYDQVWDYENSADDNTLNVHISKLRKKLKDAEPDFDYIETVWGIGYRLRKNTK